jgi:uncharacterized protein YjbI with pentapeptide repeats
MATTVVAISTAIVAIRTFTVSERTLEANTRQQTSDRFVKAIEQLANDKSLDVRMGGIFGLEQLARDWPSDHPPVFDVLTAFVRGRVPAGTGKCADPSLHLDSSDESPSASPSDDVQAAVTAIARRDRKYDRKDQVLDLSRTCLVVAKWIHLQLPGVSLENADLRSADLSQADLHETNLNFANLAGADVDEANLAWAHFYGANLAGTEFVSTNLTGAQFTDANLAKADLVSTNLTQAFLIRANLTGAALSDANLSGAVLEAANLTGANLGRSDVPGFRLGVVPISPPHTLAGADLSGADLIGANLSGANLSGANLSGIYYDTSTQWPNGFRPPPSRPAR